MKKKEAAVIVVILLAIIVHLRNFPDQVTRYGTKACKDTLQSIAGILKLTNRNSTREVVGGQIIKKKGDLPCSWRVLMSDYNYAEYRYNEPWDSPVNTKVSTDYYHCAKDTSASFYTSYVAIIGPSTPFPLDRFVNIDDLRDNPQNTILVAEMHNSGIHWREPRDLPFEQAVKGVGLKDQPSIRSNHTYFGGKNATELLPPSPTAVFVGLNRPSIPKSSAPFSKLKTPTNPKLYTAIFNLSRFQILQVSVRIGLRIAS